MGRRSRRDWFPNWTGALRNGGPSDLSGCADPCDRPSDSATDKPQGSTRRQRASSTGEQSMLLHAMACKGSQTPTDETALERSKKRSGNFWEAALSAEEKGGRRRSGVLCTLESDWPSRALSLFPERQPSPTSPVVGTSRLRWTPISALWGLGRRVMGGI